MMSGNGSALSKGLPELLKQVLSKLEQRDKVFDELVKTVVEQQQELAKEITLLKENRQLPVIKVSLDEDEEEDLPANEIVLKSTGKELVGVPSKSKEKEGNVAITVNVYKCGFCFFPWAVKTSEVASV